MFFNYRKNFKSKAKTPKPSYNIRRVDPPAPHLYASPQIIDINEKSSPPSQPFSQVESQTTSSSYPRDLYFAPPKSPTIPPASPVVKLDIDLSPEPDWFPADLLRPDKFQANTKGSDGGASGSRNGKAKASEVGEDRNGRQSRDDQSISATGDDHLTGDESYDDEGSMFALEDVMDVDLETQKDSSRFPRFVESPEKKSFDPSPAAYRKPAPAPIKIPNSAMHAPKVQIMRSSGMPGGNPSSRTDSRPDSQYSADDASAVSGTTLARALIANSFILSSDHRASRYNRGSVGPLTRQDSATLPRGEHPFLNSPYWRDRTISGGSIILTPGSGDGIPPVPPVPANADLLYIPPRTPRHSSGDKSRRPDLFKRSSTSSIPSRSSSDDAMPYSRPRSWSRPESIDLQALRRISRISEGTSPVPGTPEQLSIHGSKGASASSHSLNPPSVSSKSRNSLEPQHSDALTSPGLLPTSPLPEPPNSGQSGQSVQSAQSGQSGQSGQSVQDIANVLDYYEFANTMDPSENVRPLFSPIAEETSSQLSPPTPYRQSDNDSRSSFQSGRAPPSSSSSSTGGRFDRSSSSNQSDSRPSGARESNHARHPLLPIGERPRSAQTPHSPGFQPHFNSRDRSSSSAQRRPSRPTNGVAGSSKITSTSTLASLASSNAPLAPPPVHSIFNRQRSGSAPSPIRVVRDSKDYTAYNITVTPLAGSPVATTPSTGNSDVIRQDFPETPSAFSPTWSSSGMISPSAQRDLEFMSMIVPPIPQTPGGSSPIGIQPSLAQQVLLTRAATSVRGARHSRQASMNQARNTLAQHPLPHARPVSKLLTPPDEEVDTPIGVPVVERSFRDKSLPATPASGAKDGINNPPSALDERASDEAGPSSLRSDPPSNSRHESLAESISLYSTSPSLYGPASAHSAASVYSSTPSKESSSEYSRATQSSETSSDIATLPQIQLPVITEPLTPANSSPSSSHTKPAPTLFKASDAANSSSEPLQTPIPAITSSDPSPPSPSTVPRDNTSSPQPSYTRPPPLVLSPPAPAPILPPSPPSSSPQPSTAFIIPLEIDAGLHPDSPLGAPPPYHTVINQSEDQTPDNQTPSTGGRSGPDPDYRFGTNRSSDSLIGPNQPPNTANASRRRTRPPLPVGPRRPSTQGSGLPTTSMLALRQRNGSISSQASNTINRSASGTRVLSTSAPRFQTPPLKWRGYTMDAAKWTFTSSQLQNIVSRAIRQSAEASSIRLLRLETLDNDIPQEMHRLEMQRTDAKTRYKMLARRRGVLLASMTSALDGSEPENSGSVPRMLEELTEISAALDQSAEDLHSVDEQISQLTSLCDVHSASALAMALRKLNASFLKQVADGQALRMRVEALEAERDEAWKQAEDVASDYDHLTGRAENSLPASPRNSNSGFSRRSSVMAVRKSSIRVSKAGLRSSSTRRSQRSSVASNGQRISVSSASLQSAAKTGFSLEDIPPVPPIPSRRPGDIVTSGLSSSMGISTDGTPTSETRALVQAQEELYDMLGIAVNERKGPRRTRSTSGLSLSAVSPATGPSKSERPVSGTSFGGRPASLPGTPGLKEVYNVMTAERKAMLATLGLMSD